MDQSLPRSSVSATELADWLQEKEAPQLLDVRNREEHDYVNLPGATLIPLPELEERWKEIVAWKDAPVVVLCHHGVRSQYAIGFLREMGFSRLTNLTGGIDRWSVEVDSSKPRY